MTRLFLAAALLGLLAAAPAVRADGFCPSYGVKCYRMPEVEPAKTSLADFLGPEGDYMGSIFLPDGQTRPGWFDCEPVRTEYRDMDFDALCNERFGECLGRCRSE